MKRGFTLLEVMVAMAILATVLVVLLQNHGMSIRMSQRARDASVAANLARDLMTEAELEGFPEVATESGDFSGMYPALYQGFTWERDINESVFADYIREITVRVYYPVESGQAMIELIDMIGAKDLEEQAMAGYGAGDGTSAGEQALNSAMGRMSGDGSESGGSKE